MYREIILAHRLLTLQNKIPRLLKMQKKQPITCSIMLLIHQRLMEFPLHRKLYLLHHGGNLYYSQLMELLEHYYSLLLEQRYIQKLQRKRKELINMKKFISNKGIGFYLLLVASILSFISAILFSTCREGKETWVIVLSVIAGIIALLVSFKRFKFTEYIPLIVSVKKSAS